MFEVCSGRNQGCLRCVVGGVRGVSGKSVHTYILYMSGLHWSQGNVSERL